MSRSRYRGAEHRSAFLQHPDSGQAGLISRYTRWEEKEPGFLNTVGSASILSPRLETPRSHCTMGSCHYPGLESRPHKLPYIYIKSMYSHYRIKYVIHSYLILVPLLRLSSVIMTCNNWFSYSWTLVGNHWDGIWPPIDPRSQYDRQRFHSHAEVTTYIDGFPRQ